MSKKAIEEKTCIKYLGVIIDSKLSFFQHAGSIKKKISRAIGILYKIRNFVTKSILINLYYSLIYPFLIYAVHIWGGTSDKNLRPLHVLQKKLLD